MSYEVSLNAKQINEDEKKKFGLMPDGEYPAMMTDYEAKQGPKGEYLEATFQILEGDFKNRRIFDRYFINASAGAINMAHAKWSAIAVAVGLESIKNLDQIINKPFLLKVGTEIGVGTFSDKNIYKGAKALKADLTARPNKPVVPSQPTFQDDDLI